MCNFPCPSIYHVDELQCGNLMRRAVKEKQLLWLRMYTVQKLPTSIQHVPAPAAEPQLLQQHGLPPSPFLLGAFLLEGGGKTHLCFPYIINIWRRKEAELNDTAGTDSFRTLICICVL